MSTVRSYPKSAEITDKILKFFKDDTLDNQVSLSKVSLFNQFVQCYPIIVKKNKNASPGMEYIMTDQNPKVIYIPFAIQNNVINFVYLF